MTGYAPSAPRQNPGRTMRTLVAAVAGIAMAEAIVGAVIGVTAPPDRLTTQLGIGAALATMGLVQGAGCLWHGSRNQHERGRSAAIAAVVVALFALAVMALPVLLRRW
ncbi:MAG TPA: hypothetical protein VNA20_05950 [Frankiaceae bacterium]|nr:hypothetical protein [Frankiaceae bacterium]